VKVQREMNNNFWQGFLKRADAGTGGSGFSGTGRGNLPTGTAEVGGMQGSASSSNSSGEDTRTDKTLLDRQRNPKDFCFGHWGQDLPAESNPHIIY